VEMLSNPIAVTSSGGMDCIITSIFSPPMLG
jgi:hypothetical protein